MTPIEIAPIAVSFLALGASTFAVWRKRNHVHDGLRAELDQALAENKRLQADLATTTDTLHAAIVKAARTPQYDVKVKEMGVELVLNTPADFKQMMTAEVAKFADLVKRANIKLD